jgi:hypothetical protein
MGTIQINRELLEEFERRLDPRYPERSPIPARILGYGEISTVFEIQAAGLRGLAFKRLPLFYNQAEVQAYRAAHQEYNRLLEQDIGISLPPYGDVDFPNASGRPIFYIVQKQLPSDSIGSRAMRLLPREAVPFLVTRVLQELRKVWDFNRKQDRVQVAIDGQISNWAIADFDVAHPRIENASLLYLDTSTPLYRLKGVEQLNTELFLRSAPSFLVWILRLLFLKDVVNRYYDFHLVAVDLVANFYKEQKPQLISEVIRAVNDFFAGEAAELGIQPVTEREVESYYREDALIWSLYLTMRKWDRFLRTQLLRQGYPYILPERIKR